MIEIQINLRSKTSQEYIWAVGTHEQFPLHPNYSTSVKVRGPYYHSTSYLDCAGRAHLGRWKPVSGKILCVNAFWDFFVCEFSKIRPEKSEPDISH